MQFSTVTLPKPKQYADVGTWATAFVDALENVFGSQGGHVTTRAIPKSRLPSAAQTGIILTVLDDTIVGKVQVYSDGTQWLRIFDNQAIDSALATQVDSLNGLTGTLALVGAGLVTITPGVPAANNIQVSVVHPAPARTYAVSTVDFGAITTAWANVTGLFNLPIAGAAVGGKKFKLSFSGEFERVPDATFTYENVMLRVAVGPAGSAAAGTTDTIVIQRSAGIDFLAPEQDISVGDFEIQTTAANDKVSLGVAKAGYDLTASVYNLLGAAPYYTFIEVEEVHV